MRILYQSRVKNPVFLHALQAWYYWPTMNEKITKKIGEAYAFAQVLETTFVNNETVMNQLLQGAAGSAVSTAS